MTVRLTQLRPAFVLTFAWADNVGYGSGYPTAYNGSDYLAAESDGSYVLRYAFTLADGSADATYDCELYLDSDGDGYFSGENGTIAAAEKCSGLRVYALQSDGSWTELGQTDGHYTLTSDGTYQAYRAEYTVPSGTTGLISWKLILSDNDASGVRIGRSGQTAIAADTGSAKTYQALQIASENEGWTLASDSELTGLLDTAKSVTGNTIVFTSLKLSEIYEDADKKYGSLTDADARYDAYYSYVSEILSQYDLIVLGCGSDYQFGPSGRSADNMAAAAAVRDWIEDGQRAIVTHDALSYVSSSANSGYSWYRGYELNRTLRAAIGQDRYGELKAYYSAHTSDGSDAANKRNSEYLSVLQSEYDYDTIQQGGSDMTSSYAQGYTNHTIVRFLSNRITSLKSDGLSGFYFPLLNSLTKSMLYDTDTVSDALAGTYGGQSLIATQVNDGAITSYPFEISEDLTVSNTCYPWYQLSMALDRDDDGLNDITVWYCLSDVNGVETNLYNQDPNNIVNSYYLYTMGNVTYSGIGYTTPTTEEKKLFVNTLVAALAYDAPFRAKKPSVALTSEDGTSDQTAVRVTIDPDNGLVLDTDDITTYFTMNDTNANGLTTAPELRVEFFLGCEESDALSGVTGLTNVKKLDASFVTVEKVRDSSGTAVTAATLEATTLASDANDMDGYFQNDYYVVENGAQYRVTIDYDALGLVTETTDAAASAKTLEAALADTAIYIRATTVYTTDGSAWEHTSSATDSFTISLAELFELD